MENNSQSRTLYIIQILTIVILILLLIVHILPFFGISPTGQKPQYYTLPKPGQSGSNAMPSQQTSLYIPPLALEK